jgi:hypothetical protein
MNIREATRIASELCDKDHEELKMYLNNRDYAHNDVQSLIFYCRHLRAQVTVLKHQVERFQKDALIDSDLIPLREDTELMAFVLSVYNEVERARQKHPDCHLTAIAEEVGEVARALQDEPLENIRKECIQLACTAARVAIEGDPTMDPYRVSKGLEPTHQPSFDFNQPLVITGPEDDVIKAVAADKLAATFKEAVTLIHQDGGVDGAHHKQWLLDQVVRTLMGDRYQAWVEAFCKGEDGPDTYAWDEGRAP